MDRDLGLDAVNDISKREFQINPYIFPITTRPAASTRRSSGAKKDVEQVGDISATKERVGRLIVGRAVLVESGTFIGIGQNCIGSSDFFELLFCAWVVWVNVRMVPTCKAAVCGLNFIRIRASRNP
jgi:hypothetical protein